jgi:hypothetical protein
VVGWEDVPSDKGPEAQEVINSYINDDYDIFLGLMGFRLGSPTRAAASGTVEEYERALELSRLNPEVRVKFYVKQFPPSQEREPEVTEFLERLKGDGVLYVLFTSPEDLGRTLRLHLGTDMGDWSRRGVEVKEKDSDA